MIERKRIEEMCAEYGLSENETPAFIDDVLMPLNKSLEHAYALFGTLLTPEMIEKECRATWTCPKKKQSVIE